jgi:hypothetical protein
MPRASLSRLPLHGGFAEKYEDAAGTALPPQTEDFLDTWKRPEELVLNMPDVPMIRFKRGSTPPATGKGGKRTSPGPWEHLALRE